MKTETIKLSASRLGSYIECPACFWRDYYKKLPPTSPLPGVLNRMDALTKEYYDRFRNAIPPSIKGKIREKLVDDKTAEILRKGIKFFDSQINAVFSGKMDDCLIDSKGRLVPIDNKTAKPSDDWRACYQLQLDGYTLLLQKNKYKTADYGYVIYYTPEKGDPQKGIIFNVEVEKLKMHPKHALDIFREAVKLLRRPTPPRYHRDCEMCKFLGSLEG